MPALVVALAVSLGRNAWVGACVAVAVLLALRDFRLTALLPVTAVAIGWLVLDQRPSPIDLVGIGLVLAGVAMQDREELTTVPELEPS